MASILVRATQIGYYNHQRRYPAGYAHRRAGQPFPLRHKEDFSERWMEKVDGRAKEAEKEVVEAETESEE